ncbi:hypothetical protein H0E87_015020 [Populus deltoides]|uniref:Uncharacterized protein n=1 Tax=Populus deltoides TaxID=3696 RepID=A0A8T2Y3H8_POPDE|nr:hypothetical protein H0E87_015020 [Populus deltoides]
MQWIALDRVSYRRSVWVIHLWMTCLSWYLSHLRVVFIALWLVAAAIIVDRHRECKIGLEARSLLKVYVLPYVCDNQLGLLIWLLPIAILLLRLNICLLSAEDGLLRPRLCFLLSWMYLDSGLSDRYG